MARKHRDQYETHPEQVDALMNHAPVIGWRSNVILEPFVGTGAIVNRLYECDAFDRDNVIVYTNDIDEKFEATFHMDATKEKFWLGLPDIDWIVTNPPYSHVDEILPFAWESCMEGMAMLLGLNILEPTGGRGDWLKHHPPTSLLIFGSPRPRYLDKGTFFITTAWFVWDKHKGPGTCQIRFLPGWKDV
jgi:hypothetical protein